MPLHLVNVLCHWKQFFHRDFDKSDTISTQLVGCIFLVNLNVNLLLNILCLK